ncbi:MAG: 16S rRNA (cytidine(1402)-2'-O)-methyltransferase, partial [Candidatus Levyibacteriota bacterium]
EDTRRTGMLLHEITKQLSDFVESPKPRLISYYEQNEEGKIAEILSLLASGLSVALVSDAGTPTISDPGYKLVRTCIEKGIRIESIPGPSSVVTALTVSGLPTDKFLFVGYPPKKEGHRKDFYNQLVKMGDVIKTTVILFEAPHKLLGTLAEMENVFGKEKKLVICRELTKMHEEVLRDSIANLLAHFTKTPPKGELVILFHTKD